MVVFTKSNARILTNPPDIHLWEGRSDVMINPSFDKVKRIPPHYWKQGENNTLVSMSDEEKRARDQLLQKEGAINNIEYPVKIITKIETITKVDLEDAIFLVLFGLANGLILGKLFL